MSQINASTIPNSLENKSKNFPYVCKSKDVYDVLHETSQDNLNKAILQEKDYAPADFSGLGRVVLQKNLINVGGVTKNWLTQEMMLKSNTIYVVQYNFDIDTSITSGTAEVSTDNISQCVNPDYAAAITAYNLAHNAWIDADNAYTNNPNESTLATKNAAYAVLQDAQEALDDNPQYYYYASTPISVAKSRRITIPNGCVLLNENLNGVVSFDIAPADTTVYIGGKEAGSRSYTIQYVITVPLGCVIKFEGGSIANGIMVGNNTYLVYERNLAEVMPNVTREGTFVYNNTLSADEESLTEQGNLVKIKDAGVQGKHLNANVVDNSSLELTNNKLKVKDAGIQGRMLNPNTVDDSTLQIDNNTLKIKNGGITGNKLNSNVVDDEDIYLTSDNKLQFKDRGTTNGMGRKILRKNIVNSVNTLTQSMISDANTIYVIQYDFTLGGNITIPANCVLEFNGGSISGAHTLTGANTGIEAGLIKIFATDIIINGRWNIKQWECDWFGAVNDGLISYVVGVGSTFTGTDNFNAIQCALYTAYNTNINKVHIGFGNFRLSKPIFIGYNSYNSVSLYGSGEIYQQENTPAKKGTRLLFDTEIGGIFINSGRGNEISNISIFGKNYKFVDFSANTFATVVSDDKSDFYYSQTIEHNGIENAGIIIDGICNNSDYTPFTSEYNMNVSINAYSSLIHIKNVTVYGFYSCVDIQNFNSTGGNADFIYFNDCHFGSSAICIRDLASQGRVLDVNRCQLSTCHTCITNHKEGTSKYGDIRGQIRLCQFGMCYQIMDITSYPMTFYNCAGEVIYKFGHYMFSNNVEPNLLIGCNITFVQSPNNDKIGLVPLITNNTQAAANNAVLINCSFRSAKENVNLFMPLVRVEGKALGLRTNVLALYYVDYVINNINLTTQIVGGGCQFLDVTGDVITLNRALNVVVGEWLVIPIKNAAVFEVTEVGTDYTKVKALNYVKNGELNTDFIPIPEGTEAYTFQKTGKPQQTYHYYPATIGATSGRPERAGVISGYEYFDTTLGKPIYWNGTAWVDATGITV